MHGVPGISRQDSRLFAEAFPEFGIGERANVRFPREPVAVVGDPTVDHVPQRLRDETGECHQPPPAAEGSGEFDEGITFEENFPIGFAQEDHGATGFGRVSGKVKSGSEPALQGGEGNLTVFVQCGHAPHGAGAESAVAVEE